MLDVVFVALGFAVIALMGLYAAGLLIQIIDFWKGNQLLLGRETGKFICRRYSRAVVPNLASICGIAQ